jgi:hypothetical protein
MAAGVQWLAAALNFEGSRFRSEAALSRVSSLRLTPACPCRSAVLMGATGKFLHPGRRLRFPAYCPDRRLPDFKSYPHNLVQCRHWFCLLKEKIKRRLALVDKWLKPLIQFMFFDRARGIALGCCRHCTRFGVGIALGLKNACRYCTRSAVGIALGFFRCLRPCCPPVGIALGTAGIALGFSTGQACLAHAN